MSAVGQDLMKLYSQRILALAAGIPHVGRLPAADGSAMKRSPLCGSTVTVDVAMDGDRIAEFAQDVKACALGQSSASVLGGQAIGRTRDEIATGARPARGDAEEARPGAGCALRRAGRARARQGLQEPPRLDPARLGRDAGGHRPGRRPGGRLSRAAFPASSQATRPHRPRGLARRCPPAAPSTWAHLRSAAAPPPPGCMQRGLCGLPCTAGVGGSPALHAPCWTTGDSTA